MTGVEIRRVSCAHDLAPSARTERMADEDIAAAGGIAAALPWNCAQVPHF